MATRNNETTFISWNLTEEELLSAQVLNDLQTKLLQSKLCFLAEEKLNIVFDPNDPKDFAQQIAYKQGQIVILRELLDDSVAATDASQQLSIDN